MATSINIRPVVVQDRDFPINAEESAQRSDWDGCASKVHNSLSRLSKISSSSISDQEVTAITKASNAIETISKRAICRRLESLFQDPANLPNVMIIGKPGAGKGSLSKMLSKHFGYIHLSIGDIHRREGEAGKTELGLQIQECAKRKDFFGPEMQRITKIILDQQFQTIQENHKHFILDNFPTSKVYLPYLYQAIERYHFDRIILIVPELSDQEAIERLSNRLVCSNPSCALIYSSSNKKFAPQKTGICDECGAKLIKRLDDPKTAEEEAKVLQNKLEVFRTHIRPVIESISAERKVETFIVDNPDLTEVFTRIIQSKHRSVASFLWKIWNSFLSILLACTVYFSNVFSLNSKTDSN